MGITSASKKPKKAIGKTSVGVTAKAIASPKAKPGLPASNPKSKKALAAAELLLAEAVAKTAASSPTSAPSPTKPVDEEAALPEEERVALALAAIRRPREWLSGYGDLFPVAAAGALQRPVHVRHTNGHPTTRIDHDIHGQALTGSPLTVVRQGNHYLGKKHLGRTKNMPAYGDCFFHALLYAMGRADFLDRAAVVGLRNLLGDYVEQPEVAAALGPFIVC